MHHSRAVPTIALALVVMLAGGGLASASSVRSDATADQPDAVENAAPTAGAALLRTPLAFIENAGQVDDAVAYLVQGRDKSLFFTAEGVTYLLSGTPIADDPESAGAWSVKLDFVGANPGVRPIGQDLQQGVVSYFQGDRADWRTGMRTFRELHYPALWDGVDLAFSGSMDRLKYAFTVSPGADPDRIRLAYRGASSVRLNAQGQIEVTTPRGDFHDAAPIAYQTVDGRRVDVPVRYTEPVDAEGGAREYGFALGAYDPALPLVIDPMVLVYAGFIGGAAIDWAYDVTVDAEGNAYVVGDTNSHESSFPATVGPYTNFHTPSCIPNACPDGFIAKVRADGTGLIYAGYLGGSYIDHAYGVAVDAHGNAYVTGETKSENFPLTTGITGCSDAFVVKVNADGTGLDWTTLLGGHYGYATSCDGEWGKGVAVDTSGAVYVAGTTSSCSFSVSPGLHQGHDCFGTEAFVAKLDSTGGVLYTGVMGAPGFDQGEDVAVDSTGAAYVVGTSGALRMGDGYNAPVMYGHGSYDAFVAKVRADGTAFEYQRFIGGSVEDSGRAIHVDALGRAYVAGETRSNESTFPDGGSLAGLGIPGYDQTYNGAEGHVSGAGGDAFVVVVSPDGASLEYATYLGSSGTESFGDMAVDDAGRIHLVGKAGALDFPAIRGPQPTSDHAFVTRFAPDGLSLDYSVLLGNDDVTANGVAVDSAGNTFVVGTTTGMRFPAFVGPFLVPNWTDAYVARIGFVAPPAPGQACFSDDFNGGTLDPNWNLAFLPNSHNDINVLDWTGGVANGVFGITDIQPFEYNPTRTTSHDYWSILAFNRTIPPHGDFDASVRVHWDSDNHDAAMQLAYLQLLAEDGTVVAAAGIFDGWLFARGTPYAQAGETVSVGSFNTLPFAGSATLRLVRSSSNITAYWNGFPLVVGASSLPVVTYQLRVQYYPLNTPGWSVSTFGSFTFDDAYISSATSPVIAAAGDDQSVPEGALVTLDGSGSTSPCGSARYAWSQIAGPSVPLTGADTATPSFTAPLVAMGGAVLTFQLVVSDGPKNSEPDVVNVHVTNGNNPPVALADDLCDGNAVGEVGTATLDGSNSYDTDGEPLSYAWSQTGGVPVTLVDADSAVATFATPPVGPAGEMLTFELTVSDGEDSSTITVQVCIVNANHPPVVDAGLPQTVVEGASVTLDATGSSDQDGDNLTFEWTQLSGPAVALTGDDTATPSFTAPQVGSAGATLVFRVTVSDDYGGSGSAEVTITVQDSASPPECDLARPNVADLWPPNHKMIPITIEAVTHGSNSAVSITILSVTQDEPVTGAGDDNTSPDASIQGSKVLLRAERAGGGNGRVYRITFEASDGNGGTCTGSVTVRVPHDKGKNAPPAIDDGQVYNSLVP